MILEKSQDTQNKFYDLIAYFGIAITRGSESARQGMTEYQDLEKFFLLSTKNMEDPRVAEGVLCWVHEYGRLLNPSKIRKLIKEGADYHPAVLGGMIEFVKFHKITDKSIEILRPFTKKFADPAPLKEGPRVRLPEPNFALYNVLIPSYRLDKEKFLQPREFVLKKCPEILFRKLFGSASHADLAALLLKSRNIQKYEAHKITGHHKHTIYKIFDDVYRSLEIYRFLKMS